MRKKPRTLRPLNYDERLRRYEQEKYQLAWTCKDQKEYERKAIELAKKWRI